MRFPKVILWGNAPYLTGDQVLAHDLGDILMKTSVFAPLVIVICALSLAACANTVRGVGKDVKDTGRAVQQTIE